MGGLVLWMVLVLDLHDLRGGCHPAHDPGLPPKVFLEELNDGRVGFPLFSLSLHPNDVATPVSSDHLVLFRSRFHLDRNPQLVSLPLSFLLMVEKQLFYLGSSMKKKRNPP